MEATTEAKSAAPAREAPTVGRRVWYWGDSDVMGVIDTKQPFDAGVLFVHEDGTINVMVTNHEGGQQFFDGVHLCDPFDTDRHGNPKGYATWMPYQVKKAKQDAASPATSGAGTGASNA